MTRRRTTCCDGGSKPVILVVNKADNQRLEHEGAEFHRLGWEETYAISAAHGRGTGDLLDAVVWALPPESASEVERKRREAEIEADVEAFGEEALSWQLEAASAADEGEVDPRVAAWDAQVAADQARASEPIRVAFVGRPNVGKIVAAESPAGRGAGHRERDPGHDPRRHRHRRRLERGSHPAHRHGRPATPRQGRLGGRLASATPRCAPSGPSNVPTSPCCSSTPRTA